MSARQGRQDSNLQPPVLETGALPIAPRPWAAGAIVPASGRGSRDAQYAAAVQRRALGVLFTVIAVSLGFVAVWSALSGGRAWVVAFAAGALALWMGDLARRVWP